MMLRGIDMTRVEVRLVLALAPGLLLGTLAVAIASAVDAALWRITLELIAVGCVAAMSWRVGAAALNGSITRAHGVPDRLHVVAGDRRKPTFDRETGLHAEWYFRLRVDEEIARARRYDQPFTVITVASDTRDTIDTLRFAVRQWLREVDFAGDLGNTIALCLPSTTRSGAIVAVDRLIKLTHTIEVTVAEYPTDGPTVAALLGEQYWQTGGLQHFAS